MTTLFVDLRHDLATLEKKIGIPHQPCQTLDAMYSRLALLLDRYCEPEEPEESEKIWTLRFVLSRRAMRRRYRMRHREKFNQGRREYGESHREQLRAYNRACYRKKKERQQQTRNTNQQPGQD